MSARDILCGQGKRMHKNGEYKSSCGNGGRTRAKGMGRGQASCTVMLPKVAPCGSPGNHVTLRQISPTHPLRVLVDHRTLPGEG